MIVFVFVVTFQTNEQIGVSRQFRRINLLKELAGTPKIPNKSTRQQRNTTEERIQLQRLCKKYAKS
jgi:hypothetical protein